MRGRLPRLLGFLALLSSSQWSAATDHYVSLLGGNLAPFTNWITAATNIQNAIDVSSVGDTVWVTNGVYATGGKVIAGDLTNRVALDRAVTVQSVNGPLVTAIEGVGSALGGTAVRCAWLTNGAQLKGFTIRYGATRATGDPVALQSGGGVWSASKSSIVANCMILTNAAVSGGGTYQGTILGCFLFGNKGLAAGSASYASTLNNCTATSNSLNGAMFSAFLTNCIVVFNSSGDSSGGTVFAYCCTSLVQPGNSNFVANPQFLADGIHLGNNSPCRSTGAGATSGTDIDGEPWSTPPSVGCDQWQPAPSIPAQPKVQVLTDPVGLSIAVTAMGQEPFTCWWTRDGVMIEDDGHYASAHTTNLLTRGVTTQDLGGYQVVVSNSFGIATSAVVQVVGHYVNAASTTPVSPYLGWTTAASGIQDAIDAAAAGDVVFVTNGTYSTGGRVAGGSITNRIVLGKALIVQSMNGASTTVIAGAWDPSTNGPAAVRCAWMTNGAVLSGFTLSGGATRELAGAGVQEDGGGVFGATNSTVANSLITGNVAAYAGGGAYQARLINCILTANWAIGTGEPGFSVGLSGEGGGASRCILRNCIVAGNAANNNGGGAAYSTCFNCAFTGNSSIQFGGAAYYGSLVNCTASGNFAGGYGNYGSAVVYASLTNSIVIGNSSVPPGNTNYYSCTFSYCCTTPLPAGTGNIEADPQFIGDGVHISITSPCRGVGASSIAIGTDIDGQAWNNPPAIGCDEWLAEPVIVTQPQGRISGKPVLLSVGPVIVAGQEPFGLWWNKNGVQLENGPHYSSANTTTLVASNFGPVDAGSYQITASNFYGMATSALASVVVHCVDIGSAAPVSPYSSWLTAATNIQDAIDIAGGGEFVLVTNGLFKTGGRAVYYNQTNRIAVTKTMTIKSLNGAAGTIIEGAWDAATNGPLAVRCAWLADGAILDGFTLQRGATRATGFSDTQDSGGGIWGASSNSFAVNCTITNNAAYYGGGGCYRASLLNCWVQGNQSMNYGGGAYQAALTNCYVQGNSAKLGNGGGIYQGKIGNCTVVGNSAGSFGNGLGGGISATIAVNSIVYNNDPLFPWTTYANYHPSSWLSYSCTTPAVTGVSNISASPQILWGPYLTAASPCRGAGNGIYTSGTDIDGDAWKSPPSMGCDEYWDNNVTGPLAVWLEAGYPLIPQGKAMPLFAGVFGRAIRTAWSYGDGSVYTNANVGVTTYAWTNIGNYTVTFTAFNLDNPNGVSTNIVVSVVPLVGPTISGATLMGNNFSLSFPSLPGATYIVETATSLTNPVTWATVSTKFPTDTNLVQVTDSKATNAMRFYRIRVQ